MRVCFVGSHATGKTTLGKWTALAYGLPFLSEIARTVLAEDGKRLRPEFKGDLASATTYQVDVFRRQMSREAEMTVLHPAGFVADRAFDNLAYAAQRALAGTVGQLLDEPGTPAYLEAVRGARVFFVRPHRELLEDDGLRVGITWDEVVRIDGAVLALLEVLRVRYVPISCYEMSDRVRVITGVLGDPEGARK